MGYTSDPTASHELLTLVQTPENVKAVRLRAGWTLFELSIETGLDQHNIAMVEIGRQYLPDDDWRKILTVCGRRTFDAE